MLYVSYFTEPVTGFLIKLFKSYFPPLRNYMYSNIIVV